MLYPLTCTAVKVLRVGQFRCTTWRPIAELMCVCTNTWHEMQVSDQLRAPSNLSHEKGPSLPTKHEAIDIMEGG